MELDFIEVQIRDKMREKQPTRISHLKSVSRLCDKLVSSFAKAHSWAI